MEAKSSEKGMVMATMRAPRRLPRKRKRMSATRKMPSVRLWSTVAVVSWRRSLRSRKGTIFTPGGRTWSLSSSTLAWMPSRVVSEFSPFCSRTMPSTTSLSSMSLPSSRRMSLGSIAAGAVFGLAGLADLAEADLWALDDARDVGDADGRAVGGLEDDLLDVVHVGEEANLLDVDLLLALLDEAAAGVDVVGGDLLLDLLDGEAVGDELVGVDDDLVLAGDAAEAGDVDDAGNAAEGFFELPVLDALELHGVDGGVGALEGVPVDLADGAPVGAHLGLEAGGKGDLAEALEDLLAVPVVDAVVVEDHGDAGEAGERGGAQVGHVGDARHADFEGDGDLLLDVFGGAAGPLGDDVDVVVGDVGIGLDGEVVKGDDAPAEQAGPRRPAR